MIRSLVPLSAARDGGLLWRRLSDKAELRLSELETLLHFNKNAVIEKAVLELDERISRRVSVRNAFDVVRVRDAELLERLSR